MPRQPWIADVIADEFRGSKGFRVDAIPNFEIRGSTNFWPEGVMQHHTGRGSYNALLNYMAFNSRIAPLSNIATQYPIDRGMRITIMAAGRANHAGVGKLPWRPNEGSTGNPRTFGIENQNTGGQPWHPLHVEAMTRIATCLLRHMKKKSNRLLDHQTYAPTRKVDRTGVGLLQRERIAVQLRLASKPVTRQVSWEEFWMSLTPRAQRIGEELLEHLAGGTGVEHGDSFSRQFLEFHRNERGPLRQFLKGLESMDTNPGTLGGVLVALVREARAKGWDIDRDAFADNAHYRYGPNGDLETSLDGENWTPVIRT